MRRIILAAFFCAISSLAQSQSAPPFTYGFVPTVAEWTSYFSGKQDYLGAPPLLITGGTLTGPLITAASLTSNAGFNIPAGVAPTSPNNGDIWETTASIFVRINGVSYDLLNGACSICAVLNGNNIFTSPIQTVMTATTTQPGWYAGLTGDTQARVRLGLNSTDVPSLAFGPGGVTNRDTFIERSAAATIRHGAPDAAAPVGQTIGVQNVVAGTSNTAGAVLTIDGSIGTGSGAGGNILFKVAPTGSSGTAQNALSTALSIFGADGGLSTGAAIDEGAGTLNLAAGLYNNGTAPVGTGGYVRGASAVTTINTVACTIGASCTISAAASLVVGSTTITSGTAGRVLFDNGGTTLGEYTITGTAGSVVMSASPTITTGLNINGTAPGAGENVLNILDAGITTAGNQMLLVLGQSNTTNNRAQFGFYFAGAGSANNHGWLGMFAADHAINWDGNGFVGINTGTNALDKVFTVTGDNNFSIDSSYNILMAGNITNTTAGNFNIHAASAQQVVIDSVGVGGGNAFVINAGANDIFPGNANMTIGVTRSFLTATFSTYVKMGIVAFASLPACGAGTAGSRMLINNGGAGSFRGTASAGGSNTIPVYCDGTNWLYGELILPKPSNDNVPASAFERTG